MISAWLHLVKFRLGLTVTLTSAAGFIIASANYSSELLITAAGVFLLAGAAGAFNQVQERDSDSLMERTVTRPIPSGSIKPSAAKLVASIMTLSGGALLLTVSVPAAALGLFNVILYNLVYTPLKRVSYLAVLPGALVGAIPPVIGWLAAGGDPGEPQVLFLFTLLFLWQVPHFWLLVINYHREYEKAGLASVVSRISEGQVRRIIFLWLTVLSLFSTTWFLFGISLPRWFNSVIPLLVLLFIALLYPMVFRKDSSPLRAFVLSNIFITLLFIAFAVGSIL